MSSPPDVNEIRRAIDLGSMDLLRRAVSMGSSVEAFEANGFSLINEMVSSCASKKIEPPNVSEMLRMGADPNKTSPHGMSPLLFVMVRMPATSVCEAVVALLCAGADTCALVDNEIADSGFRPHKNRMCRAYPLALAVQVGNLSAVEALLLGGACPDGVRGHEIISPLSFCAQWKEAAIAHLILKKGADPNLVNYDGTVALHYCWDLDTAELLHQHGARLDIKDLSLRTPLHEWCERTSDAAAIDWLGEKSPASRIAVDNAGLSPLSILRSRSVSDPGVSAWASPIIAHWEAEIMSGSTSKAQAGSSSRRL